MKALVALAAMLAAPAGAADHCVSLTRLTAPASFARFTSRPPRAPHWRGADTRRGEAHLFRTALAQASRVTPNFAGRVSVVEIGCGMGAVCPAFVDRVSGRVRFDPALRVLVEPLTPTVSGELLTYRRNSRLLVALGLPNEVEAQAGAHLFEWRDGRLHRLRFVAMRQLCGGQTR